MTQLTNKLKDSKGRYLKDSLNYVLDFYRNTTDVPSFIFEDPIDADNSILMYKENIYDKVVDLLIIVSSMVQLTVFEESTIRVLINEYEEHLDILRLICKQHDHYLQCEIYLVVKIMTLKQNLLQYELFECLANLQKFITITKINETQL